MNIDLKKIIEIINNENITLENNKIILTETETETETETTTTTEFYIDNKYLVANTKKFMPCYIGLSEEAHRLTTEEYIAHNILKFIEGRIEPIEKIFKICYTFRGINKEATVKKISSAEALRWFFGQTRRDNEYIEFISIEEI